jgi:DNA-binding PadR family transcriptional regulator
MKDEVKSLLPLAPAALHILLALTDEDRHGYGILQQAFRQSQGHYKLGPGTLYDNLDKLMNRGLVAKSARRTTKEDPRRRYYRLTEFGRRVLSADLDRLRAVVKTAGPHLSEAEAK